jgi:hypothetical protein
MGLSSRGSKKGVAKSRRSVAKPTPFCRHSPHAANAPCGSCFNLNTACFDKRSAFAMADRLGGLVLSSGARIRENAARS